MSCLSGFRWRKYRFNLTCTPLKTDTFHTIPEILSELRAGRMVIIVDDEDRENEGDLVMAAEKVTPSDVNFMAKYGRGLICVPATGSRLNSLGIGEMVVRNQESFRTDFQVSVDAAEGISTGISAADRAITIQKLADPASIAADLVQPGHIFPLRAKPGGVLQRSGHTEAAVDLAALAGLRPVAVICEIMSDDGTMARLPELREFAKIHGLKIGSIEDLIHHRRVSEKLVERVETVRMPTDYGEFDLHLYHSRIDDTHHLALVKGKVQDLDNVLVRVHSECLTGDVFGSRRCDCGPQLHAAMQRIQDEGCGVILYMRQEGRGIGLANKIRAYKLQENGFDTVDANLQLGFPMDLRDYGVGAQVLVDLGLKTIRLLTNNPKKVVGLQGYGLEIVEQLPIRVAANPDNEQYLATKKARLGHLL